MQRRNFLKTSGLSLATLLISDTLLSCHKADDVILSLPDLATAIVNGRDVQLKNSGKETWIHDNLSVQLKKGKSGWLVSIHAPGISLSSVTLHWKIPAKKSSVILNDHWERTYGDVSWHQNTNGEILPWYFMENNGETTTGFGVKTGAKAFCAWQLSPGKLNLNIDTLSGGEGVKLGDRTLEAAEIVTMKSGEGESPFTATRRFMTVMCDKPRIAVAPVYGINDWYFTYGNNSHKLILEHTQLMAPMADGLKNRPFSVIDAGWFNGPISIGRDCCFGDDMSTPNSSFSDMGKTAAEISKLGMRPAIWTRPLCGSQKAAKSKMLPLIKGREAAKPVLDPTIDENREQIKNYFKLYKQWGYEMVKFDFTSDDIFGRWGFEMIKAGSMTQPGWHMHDQSKTNAEIVLQLYTDIRESAGDMYLIGCNTFSHLSAGLFELNRIGDDTSGKEWGRTRKMGVNTLAFRGVQQGAFYGADADCVGLTNLIPWAKNKQWMDLLANSGTPLFISAQPDVTKEEQKKFIKTCFSIASEKLPVGEPLDWMTNAFPAKWKLNGQARTFNWS